VQENKTNNTTTEQPWTIKLEAETIPPPNNHEPSNKKTITHLKLAIVDPSFLS
jgi:hypothetical protein